MSQTKHEVTQNENARRSADIIARQAKATDNMFVDQCEATTKKKTEEAIKATTPWPFPFSLLQMGNPEADRSKMLADIERDRKACVTDASVAPKKKYP